DSVLWRQLGVKGAGNRVEGRWQGNAMILGRITKSPFGLKMRKTGISRLSFDLRNDHGAEVCLVVRHAVTQFVSGFDFRKQAIQLVGQVSAAFLHQELLGSDEERVIKLTLIPIRHFEVNSNIHRLRGAAEEQSGRNDDPEGWRAHESDSHFCGGYLGLKLLITV